MGGKLAFHAGLGRRIWICFGLVAAFRLPCAVAQSWSLQGLPRLPCLFSVEPADIAAVTSSMTMTTSLPNGTASVTASSNATITTNPTSVTASPSAAGISTSVTASPSEANACDLQVFQGRRCSKDSLTSTQLPYSRARVNCTSSQCQLEFAAEPFRCLKLEVSYAMHHFGNFSKDFRRVELGGPSSSSDRPYNYTVRLVKEWQDGRNLHRLVIFQGISASWDHSSTRTIFLLVLSFAALITLCCDTPRQRWGVYVLLCLDMCFTCSYFLSHVFCVELVMVLDLSVYIVVPLLFFGPVLAIHCYDDLEYQTRFQVRMKRKGYSTSLASYQAAVESIMGLRDLIPNTSWLNRENTKGWSQAAVTIASLVLWFARGMCFVCWFLMIAVPSFNCLMPVTVVAWARVRLQAKVLVMTIKMRNLSYQKMTAPETQRRETQQLCEEFLEHIQEAIQESVLNSMICYCEWDDDYCEEVLHTILVGTGVHPEHRDFIVRRMMQGGGPVGGMHGGMIGSVNGRGIPGGNHHMYINDPLHARDHARDLESFDERVEARRGGQWITAITRGHWQSMYTSNTHWHGHYLSAGAWDDQYTRLLDRVVKCNVILTPGTASQGTGMGPLDYCKRNLLGSRLFLQFSATRLYKTCFSGGESATYVKAEISTQVNDLLVSLRRGASHGKLGKRLSWLPSTAERINDSVYSLLSSRGLDIHMHQHQGPDHVTPANISIKQDISLDDYLNLYGLVGLLLALPAFIMFVGAYSLGAHLANDADDVSWEAPIYVTMILAIVLRLPQILHWVLRTMMNDGLCRCFCCCCCRSAKPGRKDDLRNKQQQQQQQQGPAKKSVQGKSVLLSLLWSLVSRLSSLFSLKENSVKEAPPEEKSVEEKGEEGGEGEEKKQDQHQKTEDKEKKNVEEAQEGDAK